MSADDLLERNGDFIAPPRPLLPANRTVPARDPDDWDRLAAQLKAARKARGLSDRHLRARLGFGVSEFEAGTKLPSLRQLIAWTAAVGVRLALVEEGP